jgi:hypothetical protein
LQGGLRAVDDRSGSTFVQLDQGRRFLKFDSPEYGQLYGMLHSFGFSVIGVEFLTGSGAMIAPDWWVASPRSAFRIEPERRAWSTLDRLCLLGEQARLASGLKGKMLHLTEDDVIEVGRI